MGERDKALEILRDAQARAATLVERNADAYTDPWWGTWFRRADERVIYKSAVERAIEALEREAKK